MSILDNSASKVRRKALIVGVFLGLCVWGLVRSCSWINQEDEMHLFIGQELKWDQLHLLGKERDLIAFNTELLKAIAQEERWRLIQSAVSDPLSEVVRGEFQGALTTLASNDVNKQNYLFSESYFQTGLILVVLKNESIDGWNEMRKRVIGIQKQMPVPIDFQMDLDMQFKNFDDVLSALVALKERSIDGVLLPSLVAHTYSDTFYKNEFNLVHLPITNQESIRLVTLKTPEGERLVKSFNEGLQIVKNNGTYLRLLLKWGFFDSDQQEQQKP